MGRDPINLSAGLLGVSVLTIVAITALSVRDRLARRKDPDGVMADHDVAQPCSEEPPS